MELRNLNKQVVDNNINNIYIFTGVEVALMDIYIEKIAEVKSLQKIRVDSLSSVYSKLSNQSLMDKEKVYIIRDDKEFTKQNEQIWEKLKLNKAQNKNIVIMIYTNIDKRSKFNKYWEDNIIEFNTVEDNILLEQVVEVSNLSSRNAQILIEYCNRNYSRIVLEIDKIEQLSKACKVHKDIIFQRAIKENLINKEPQNVIFELVDSITRKQVKKSFSLLNEFMQLNEGTLGLISLLYINFRNILIVKVAGECKDMENRTGLTGWQIRQAKEKMNYYMEWELKYILRLIRELEKDIKCGKIEQEKVIELLLVFIFSEV